MYGCVVSNSECRPNNIPTFQLTTRHKSRVEDITNMIEHNLPEDPYFIHLPYDIVVGRPSQFYINKSIKFIEKLAEEVRSDTKLVIHFGSTVNGGSLDNVIKFCQRLDHLEPRQLILENMAGSGSIMGSNIDDLTTVYSQVPRSIGFCLDSQHSFASGMIDWRNINQVRQAWNQLIEITGGIDLIHFNDSKQPWLSKKDSHERLGRGYIWKDNYKTLIQVIREAYDRNIPLIPETSNSIADAEYIGRVIDKYLLKKGETDQV